MSILERRRARFMNLLGADGSIGALAGLGAACKKTRHSAPAKTCAVSILAMRIRAILVL
jgi:hypothetical protein